MRLELHGKELDDDEVIAVGFRDTQHLVLFVDDEEHHELTEKCAAMRAAGSSSDQGDSDSDKEHAPELHTVHVLIHGKNKITLTSGSPMSVRDIKSRLVRGGHVPNPK